MPADPCDAAPAYRYQEPWTAALFDNARALSLQLVCAGGSGAIAKTAVAPLERVKVCLVCALRRRRRGRRRRCVRPPREGCKLMPLSGYCVSLRN